MLAIITLLLAALAMSVSGISIPSSNITSFSPANATMQKDTLPAQNCDLQTFNYDGCSCFAGLMDGTYGVDRSLMINAINFACDEFTGGVGDPVSVYGLGDGLTRERTYNYLYPATHDNEEGHIAVMLRVRTDDLFNCNGPIPVGWGWCWDNLHKPLDSCDTDAVDGKYGGIFLHECINWVLDPNPNINRPYEGLIQRLDWEEVR